jgi:hypothetical protein
MKNFKLSTLVTLFALTLFVYACGEHDHDHDGDAETTTQTEENNEPDAVTETVDLTSKEYASAFVCPMHCKGSGSDTAGKCPVCEMDYVANEDYKSKSEAAEESHDEEDGHEGHNH